ncbi:MAG: histidine utilization repressor [Deltaproteobacteria bacterium]|jgi:GntR family transcriptional regulator, histidine utilization repressor|nr:histidine utilization repressor [Deltaproteobacteria bacterium]MBT4525896.1 histidine utilization repressor [Deltaproteobacteria bacterium]
MNKITADKIPIYQVIKNHIVSNIQSTHWPENHQITSENELVTEFGASRMTVNRALRELTMEGWLYRVKGLGTFVARKKIKSELLEIRNIAEEIIERGSTYSCEVKQLKKEFVNQHVGSMLSLKKGEEAYHSIIVHKEDDIPVQLADRWVNPEFAPDYLSIDFTEMTPNAYLTKIVPFSKAEHILEVIMPSESVQDYLNIEAFEPCLLLHRRTWRNKDIITYATLIHPGSRYKMGVEFETGHQV